MNLLKKILPIATLGCAAVTMPFATSCAKNKKYDYSVDFGNIKQYQRTTDIYQPQSGEAKKNEEATRLYGNNIKQNPQIVIDDVFYAIKESKIWVGEDYFAKCTPYGKVGVNINDITIYDEGEAPCILLSFDVKLDIKIDFSVFDDQYTDFSVVAKCDISFERVPFDISYKKAMGEIKVWDGQIIPYSYEITLLDWKIITDGYLAIIVADKETKIDVDLAITKELAVIPGLWDLYIEDLISTVFHLHLNYLSKLQSKKN